MKRSIFYVTICTAFFVTHAINGAAAPSMSSEEKKFRGSLEYIKKGCAAATSPKPFAALANMASMLGVGQKNIDRRDAETLKRFFADEKKKNETVKELFQNSEIFTTVWAHLEQVKIEFKSKKVEDLATLVHVNTIQRLRALVHDLPEDTTRDQLHALVLEQKTLEDGTKAPVISDEAYFPIFCASLFITYELGLKEILS